MDKEYRIKKVERRLPHGVIEHRHVMERIPPRHTIESEFGKGEIAKKVCREPVTFMSDGVEHTRSVESMLHTLSYSTDIKQRRVAADGINHAKAVIREIKSENERKERMEMAGKTYTKHDTFAEYINDLQAVHDKVAARQISINDALRQAQENMDSVSINDELAYHSAQYELALAKQKYMEGLAALQKEAEQEVQMVRDAFEDHLVSFYSPSGSAINDDDVRLMQSGIKLTQGEIEAMLTRNKSNATMIRMIGDYCGKAGIDSMPVRVYGVYAQSNGKEERKVFETLAGCVRWACGYEENSSRPDKKRAEVWSNANTYGKLYKDGVEALNGMTFRPEVAAEDPLVL